MVSSSAATALLEFGVASSVLAGQTESGDLHLVRTVGDRVLVAVVDGLGHGQDAAAAARLAVETLDRHAGEALPQLVHRCHEALRSTRGVVMSLALFDSIHDTLTWVGLGNIDGVLVAGDHRQARSPFTGLVTRGGIVGSPVVLPPVRPWLIPIQPQDVLVFATDGLRFDFGDDFSVGQGSPQESAVLLLARYGKGTDDALVLVARYLGRR